MMETENVLLLDEDESEHLKQIDKSSEVDPIIRTGQGLC